MAEVRLSAPERAFLLQGIEHGLREDGRGRHDFRSFELETGLAPQTNGSARLRCPHANTDIMVGVKLEIAPPKVRPPFAPPFDWRRRWNTSGGRAAAARARAARRVLAGPEEEES